MADLGKIRDAEPADADGIGAIHVRAWQAAYRGILPDGYLDGLRVADRQEWWRSALTNPHVTYTHRLVVEDDGGIMRGFACAGPSDRGDRIGELWVLNLDPDAWGRGFGRALLEAVTGLLQGDGYREAALWVAAGNRRARRFYEIAGWRPDGTEATHRLHGVDVRELTYRRPLYVGEADASQPRPSLPGWRRFGRWRCRGESAGRG